jgi:hypothetical protein
MTHSGKRLAGRTGRADWANRMMHAIKEIL